MKAYFYKVNPHQKNDASLDRALDDLVKQFSTLGHYVDCNGTFMRIENFKRESNYCTGDLIRQQRDDLPPFAPNGKSLEPNTVPQGHRTAFLYHYTTHVLAFEANRNGVGIGTFLSCFPSMLPHSGFSQTPIISQASIDDLLGGAARSVTVKFAAPEDLSIADSEKGSDIASLNKMRMLFNAPSIEVTCGFDTPKKGSLNTTAVVKFIKDLYRQPVTAKKIQVKQEGEAELLDLLGKKLVYASTGKKLDSRDIKAHYSTRRQFLIEAFTHNSAYIQKYYRANAA